MAWLREFGYRYLVAGRERRRRFDADAAVAHGTRTGRTVHLRKVVSRDPDEVRPYCHLPERADKGAASSSVREALRAGVDGPVRWPVTAAQTGIGERIGRLKTNSRGVARHYVVDGVNGTALPR